jgi:hypothetical protein
MRVANLHGTDLPVQIFSNLYIYHSAETQKQKTECNRESNKFGWFSALPPFYQFGQLGYKKYEKR